MSETPMEDRPRRVRRRRRSMGTASAPPSAADPGAWQTVGIVAAVAVVLVVIGLLVPLPTSDGDAAGDVQPVDSSTAVCPEPGSTDGSLTTSMITVVPGQPGQDREGDATVSFLEGGESDGSGGDTQDVGDGTNSEIRGGLTAPGDVALVSSLESRLPALQVRALGGLAPGLVAAQTTRDSFSAGRGLASQPCLGPDTTWWFVGGGSTPGRETSLVLVNPESTQAELEVAIKGPDGPVSTPRLRGLVVEPRSRVVVRLSREAPRLPVVAWRVTVRQGRVMAALSDREAEGFIPRGADWIPASVDPATRVLVPGVSGGDGGRQLLIHAPGDLAATVRIRLITAQGSFVPSATPEVEVPGGSVVAVDLDESLQGEDATVDLQSDLPIVAGVRQRHVPAEGDTGSLEETSFTAGAASITGASAVTSLPAERGTRVTVWVTAPDDVIEIEAAPLPDVSSASADPSASGASSPSPSGSAPATPTPEATVAEEGTANVTLRVLPVSPEGQALPAAEDIVVSVPRGRLVAVDIPRPEGAEWFTLVATVSDGQVVIAHRATRRTKEGRLVTGYPWFPLRSAVVVPRAVPVPGLAVAGS
ncbi:MAG: DUF5719 family protein [Candidatus Nanopelagicales bacterium]